MERKKPDLHGRLFLLVSLMGLFLLAAMTFMSPSSQTIPPWQEPLVDSLFVLICLSGIVAGVSPSTCSSLLRSKADDLQHVASTTLGQNAVGEEKGHHPDCGKFSTHTFRFRGRTYCAGCTGLVIGAVAAILGTVACFFLKPEWEQIGGLLFWLGFLGVFLGLLQHDLPTFRKNYVHVILGIVFVFGAFLLLTGMTMMGNSLMVEGYFLVLSLFWILTRAILSQEEHQRICDKCGRSDCGFV